MQPWLLMPGGSRRHISAALVISIEGVGGEIGIRSVWPALWTKTCIGKPGTATRRRRGRLAGRFCVAGWTTGAAYRAGVSEHGTM